MRDLLYFAITVACLGMTLSIEARTVRSQQGSGRVTEVNDSGGGDVFTRVCMDT